MDGNALAINQLLSDDAILAALDGRSALAILKKLIFRSWSSWRRG